MKHRPLAAALVFALSSVSPVLAGPHCHAPMAEWQSREALQAKVSTLGWTIQRIKIDDGCYKVYALDTNGQRIKAKFDPATLEQMKSEREHR